MPFFSKKKKQKKQNKTKHVLLPLLFHAQAKTTDPISTSRKFSSHLFFSSRKKVGISSKQLSNRGNISGRKGRREPEISDRQHSHFVYWGEGNLNSNSCRMWRHGVQKQKSGKRNKFISRGVDFLAMLEKFNGLKDTVMQKTKANVDAAEQDKIFIKTEGSNQSQKEIGSFKLNFLEKNSKNKLLGEKI